MTRLPAAKALSVFIAVATSMLLIACANPMTTTDTRAAPAQPMQQLAPQAALQAALTAYAKENLSPLADMLPAKFVGRSIFLDAAQTTLNDQKQIRVTLSEIRIQPGTPVGGAAASTVLTARWDKRFLKLPALTPSAETGTLQAVMRWETDQWVFDSLSSDNPFVR